SVGEQGLVQTGDIAYQSVTADKLSANILEAIIANVTQEIVIGGEGVIGLSADGLWRLVIQGNRIVFQTKDGESWVDRGWIGDSEGGASSVYVFMKGLLLPGVDVSGFDIGLRAPVGSRVFDLNDSYADKASTDPWTTKDNLAFDASDKKFGTHSLESGGTTGTLAWASAIDTNSAFHIDGYVKHDFSAPTETGAVLKIEGLDISTLFDSGTKVQASDGATGDDFGYSVAISGDYAVIGAYQDDDNGSNSGSAYVFERISGTWTQTQKLTA